MTRRTLSGLGAAALTLLTVGVLAAPAYAAGETNIDYVEADADGRVTLLLAVDGVPRAEGATDTASVEVSVDGQPVAATAQPVADGDIERTTVLAMDTSNSMRRAGRFDAAKAAARAYLAGAPDDLAVGLLTFADGTEVVATPTTDHEAIAATLDGIRLSKNTHLYQGVVDSVALAGDDGARSVLLLSDGRNMGSETTLDDAVGAATDAGVVVDVVTLDDNERFGGELARIAESSGGRVVAADTAGLSEVFAAQAASLGQALVVRFDRPEGITEGAVEVSLTSEGETYVDRAFVSLGSAEADNPVPVAPRETMLGDGALLAGGAALAVGLAVLLGIVLAGGNRGPTLAQQQIAWFSGDAGVTKTAKSGAAGLKESAIQATGKVVNKDLETRISQRLAGAGSAMTAAEWILMHAGVAVAFGLVGMILRGAAMAVLLFAVGAVVPWLWLKFRHSRRLAAFNTQLPETLDLIAGGLSAGLSLPQAVDTVVREGAEPMSGELRRALVEQRLGVDITDALDGVGDRMASQDFSWVVMAIRIQREVGGNLAELLTTVSGTIRERDYLRRQVKVLSAEGRISAWVLGGLPIVMFFYMLFVQPDVVRSLYTTGMGILMLVAAVVLLVVGSFTMSKLVKVEV